MTDAEAIRNRYLQDELPIRLGGLAANLARLRSASRHAANQQIVQDLLDESKHFIEWTALDADLDTQAELVELQVQLARWELKWLSIREDEGQRRALGEQAAKWSDRILEISGLAA